MANSIKLCKLHNKPNIKVHNLITGCHDKTTNQIKKLINKTTQRASKKNNQPTNTLTFETNEECFQNSLHWAVGKCCLW